MVYPSKHEDQKHTRPVFLLSSLSGRDHLAPWNKTEECIKWLWINETERDEAGDYLEDQGLMMLIDGERANPEESWLWCMDNPISESEYNFLVADSSHAKQYRPEDAKANPHQAIDLANSKPIF